ncbi:MAG: uroporphyrinogen-III synthase, partial [Deltaproteobacteria bacterium]|nr:uroporphyrinogen-III synthase [Deltaproteobacteria bacterium]
ILVPRAEDGRDDAIAALRAAGAIVTDVVAYRTVPTPGADPAVAEGRELLATGRAAICAVFAPSQVRALDGILPIHTIATRLIAIGETTAAALAAAGVATAAVASTPTPEGIANAVASVYPQRR